MKSFFSKANISEIIRFGVTGAVSFLVDYGVMTLLKEYCGVYYLIASAAGFIVSVAVNYLLCVLWVFKKANKKSPRAMTVFVISSLIGLGLNSLFMWLFVDVILIDYRIAKVIATLLVMIWNYISKKWAVKL